MTNLARLAALASGTTDGGDYVAAILKVDGCSIPVEIAHVAVDHAVLRLETAVRVGSRVELVRASHCGAAIISHSEAGSCRIVFDTQVDADEWSAHHPTSHQQRLDAMLAEARRAMGRS